MCRHTLGIVRVALAFAIGCLVWAPPGWLPNEQPRFTRWAFAQSPGVTERAASTKPGERSLRSGPTPVARCDAKDGACGKGDHGFTPEREAAALTFVRQHHPELAVLLPALKAKDASEYCRAIRDLFRTSERLAVCRERFPDRYEVELNAWQVKSRIQLLATRLRLTPDDVRLQEQLKKALLDQVDVQLRLLKLERQRTVERLQRLDDQINAVALERERESQKRFEMLVRIRHEKPPSKQKPRESADKNTKRPTKDKDNDRRKTDKPAPQRK